MKESLFLKEKNLKKKFVLTTVLLLSLFSLSACQSITNWWKNTKEEWLGLEMTLRTFDENSQLIDEIEGKSLSIERNEDFDSVDAEGNSNADSSVLKVTIGHYEMDHVGSSLIAAEKGLEDLYAKYQTTVDIANYDRSIPLVNRMVSSLKNDFTGKAKVVLIRSQNGTPLATYIGDKVSLYASNAPKTSELLIDGKRLIIYRCDYTIYDRELFE